MVNTNYDVIRENLKVYILDWKRVGKCKPWFTRGKSDVFEFWHWIGWWFGSGRSFRGQFLLRKDVYSWHLVQTLNPRPCFLRTDSQSLTPLVLDSGKDIKVPAPINAFLRDYQREGVHFFYERYREGRGGILGDDMGLVCYWTPGLWEWRLNISYRVKLYRLSHS